MKKRKYMLFTALPLLSALSLGVGAYAETTKQPNKDISMKFMKSGKEMLHHAMPHSKETASLLGITESELTSLLAGGKTLETIITEKGFTQEAFHQKMKALREEAMKNKLTEAVASGKITQAKADKMVAEHAKREVEMRTSLAKALGITVAELDAYKAAGTPVDRIITQKGLDKNTIMKSLHAEHKKDKNFFGNLKKKFVDSTNS